LDVGEHPDMPGQVLDAVADSASVTLQHRVNHDVRREFDTDNDRVTTAGQTLVLELPPGTIDTDGQWVYQAEIVLSDRTLVWPRRPEPVEIVEAIV
jgi:hypothetical protein